MRPPQVWLPSDHLAGIERLEHLFRQLDALDAEAKAGAEGARARSKQVINELYVESARVKVRAKAQTAEKPSKKMPENSARRWGHPLLALEESTRNSDGRAEDLALSCPNREHVVVMWGLVTAT